ncbi:phage protein [Geobacillus sp. T6]|uniref:hypothetical protein n=1 Tax=Geobacillus sp. T6 TaxID=1659191 RepID=UPI000649A3AF|nr:hypothetical protein [Geobacillus sp. T6]KLR75272.1 phage protein [Geobacillus sp. T6]
MKLTELDDMLKATGFPVAYSHFSKPQKPPFITYVVAYSSNFDADDQVYHEIENIQIELYTTKKDFAAEEKVKAVLDANNLVYETSETYIPSEKLYQKVYEVRLL